MIERFALMLILLAVGYVAFWLFKRHNLQQASEQATQDPLLMDAPINRATIVYFTTPGCIPCQTQQQPALSRLQAAIGDTINIIKVDASQDPEAAQRWGVMSAPTTFVLDRTGKALAVNYGFADENKLRQQLDIAV
ncbi:MAG: thioredoxin family protein [Anaerolineae bacterium]|nr:thioredoxin family protein [Anaerolineae bacterium]